MFGERTRSKRKRKIGEELELKENGLRKDEEQEEEWREAEGKWSVKGKGAGGRVERS